jgi:Rod binding domain-containing protein
MTDVASMQATAPQKTAVNGKIGKAAEDFEGMFMTQMLQPMFDTIDVDPNFGGGHGEQVMRSFLTQEYGKLIAKNSNFGITSAVKNQMLKMQAEGQTTQGHTIKNGVASYANAP